MQRLLGDVRGCKAKPGLRVGCSYIARTKGIEPPKESDSPAPMSALDDVTASMVFLLIWRQISSANATNALNASHR